jgi:hypothetical protein
MFARRSHRAICAEDGTKKMVERVYEAMRYNPDNLILFWCDGEIILGLIISVFADHLTVSIRNGLVTDVRKVRFDDIVT